MLSIPGKIPIRIFPFFWILIAIIGWISSGGTIQGTAIWAFVILFSVLIHEFGHALTALAFGQEAHIDLVGLGGVTHRNGPKLKLWQEFLIVLDGPLAGVVLLCAAYFIWNQYGNSLPASVNYALNITVYANIFWTVINLLPVHPLDGGRLFSIILESILGVRGVKIALFLSSLVGLLMSILFFYLQFFLGGALFLMLAFESYRAWQGSLAISDKDEDQALKQLLDNGKEYFKHGRLDDAQRNFEEIRDASSSGVIYNTATELLAVLLQKQGLYREAYAILGPISKKISPESLRVYQQVAYQSGAWQEATKIGERAYQTFPTYDIALINAFSYGLLGEARPAIGWLQRALSDGLPNIKAILSKQEFDKIRSSSPFIEFVQKNL